MVDKHRAGDDPAFYIVCRHDIKRRPRKSIG